jgi:hypothetical protein
VAILGPLAAIIFSCHYFSSNQVVAAQSRRRQTENRPQGDPQRGMALLASSFKHESHREPETQLKCSNCHTIPSREALNEIAAATKSTIKGYPYHDSCLDCHSKKAPQFFRGAAPSICTVCHTHSSPRLTKRNVNPFPKQNGQMMEREFPGYFPHGIEQHQEKFVKCEECHKRDERVYAATSLRGSKASYEPAGTFKTSPSDHTTCFKQCHWQKDKPGVSFFSEGVLGKRVDGGCAGCHLTPPEIAKEPRNQLSGKAGEWFKRWPSEWPKRLVLRFNHESKDHLKTRCTECHNNLKQMNTLDVHKADVGIRQCEECHAIRPNIQVGKDKVSISDEMDCKADPKCEQNPEPGDQYICVACHTSVIGREQPPCSHYDVIGQTCPKPEL